MPLAYVEVTPIPPHRRRRRLPRHEEPTNNNVAGWTAASIKLQLLQASLQGQLLVSGDDSISMLMIEWTRERSVAFGHQQMVYSGRLFYQSTSTCSKVNKESLHDSDSDSDRDDYASKVLLLKHNNPAYLSRQCPCICRGFAVSSSGPCNPFIGMSRRSSPVVITQSTMVRIIPDDGNHSQWKSQLTGETFTEPNISQQEWQQMQYCQNPETLRELQWHLQRLLQQETWIGTTSDALEWNQQMQQRRWTVQKTIQRHMNASSETTTSTLSSTTPQHEKKRTSCSLLLSGGALLVHSSDFGDGKTRYIDALLQHSLTCHRIHRIRAGALLAKYGVYADVALAMTVHQAVLAAAFQAEPVAIILDSLDAFLPSKNDTTAATAETAVWNGMASYLRQLTHNLQQKHHIPFPGSSHTATASLYNWSARHGYVLPVQVCVIGIVTCPDDSILGNTNYREQQSILDAIVATRYRFPRLSAQTRLHAIQSTLQEVGLDLSLSSKDFREEQLPLLAASAVWLQWPIFMHIAETVKELCQKQNTSIVTLELLQEALSWLDNSRSESGYNISFSSNAASSNEDIFSTVGGNMEAKIAIQDALAIEPDKRAILASIGISPPTGILLYGPPGTGKTLLARAVAALLKSKSSSSIIGGAFIVLKSTDVAQAEVGSGEKMVAQAFDTAKKNSPAVVFIDEFQALFGDRDSSQSGSSRLSSTLLVCMDDLKRWRDLNNGVTETSSPNNTSGEVVILAATNTPWMIDKSFLRPGRFDRAVHVGLPDLNNRADIFNVHLREMKLKSDNVESLSRNLAGVTEGFSGADIVALCRAAAIHCIISDAKSVEEDHFAAVLEDGFQPSSDVKLVEKIKKWHPIA